MKNSQKQQQEIWEFLGRSLENYFDRLSKSDVAPKLDQALIKDYVSMAFEKKFPGHLEKIDYVLKGMEKFTVHTAHPSYFGLYNPKSNFAGIVADIITASLNPQLAAWSHAPFAVEVEAFLVREIGIRFGYEASKIDGCFTTGGAEANLTAIVTALNAQYPEFLRLGIKSIKKDLVMYCSSESHHSLQKAAAIVGLGMEAVKTIPAKNLELDITALTDQIKTDIKNGLSPFLIVATMGTTGTGSLDPITELHKMATENDCWLHADAAYGGAVAFHESYRQLIMGIELADSITFDAHKWLSVPMGAGMYITKHPDILSKSFAITTGYMPREADTLEVIDPYTHSIQWSRRFIGLKLYMTILFYGWDGLSSIVSGQIEKGNYLRDVLIRNKWILLNNTVLPVVCFSHLSFTSRPDLALQVVNKVIESGKAWISVYPIDGINTIRACITNFDSEKKDIEDLVQQLNQALYSLL